MSEHAQQVTTDEFRVDGRNGLRQSTSVKPVNAHSTVPSGNLETPTGILLVPPGGRTVASNRYLITINQVAITRVGRCNYRPVRLKEAMPHDAQTKHSTTEHQGLFHQPCSTGHVFNYKGPRSCSQRSLRRRQQVRIDNARILTVLCACAVLVARRTRVNRVKLIGVRGEILKRIAQNKLEGITRLRRDINSDDGEPGAVISHCCAAPTAEKVK